MILATQMTAHCNVCSSRLEQSPADTTADSLACSVKNIELRKSAIYKTLWCSAEKGG
jgi:hypothetical protein